MSERSDRTDWTSVMGFSVGVGITFVATLGVWLQYSTHAFTAVSGGALSLVIGIVVGGAWALLRRNS